MLKRFALPVLSAALFGAVMLLPGTAGAQQFMIRVHDTMTTLQPGQVVELKATITNVGFGTINLRAVRYLNDLPEGWYSAICFGDLCFPAELDEPQPARLESGDSMLFKLSVGSTSGVLPNQVLRAGIRFDDGDPLNTVSQEFTVVADPTSSAPVDDASTLRAAWPNPAATSATIPVDAAAATARVQLVDPLGRVVVDLRDVSVDSDGVRIDVASVPDGAYLYRVDAAGTSRVGRIVVAH